MIKLVVFGGMFFFFDQWSKRLAEVHTTGRSIACGRLLKIHCVTNPCTRLGAGHARIVFPVFWLVALACAIVLHNLGSWFRSQAALFGLGLAFSGAAGNLLDLLRREYVLDFIDLGWWPVFNLADVGIVTGLVVAFWPRR
jgi:signal peptidase II